jgi:hypothetical protein
MRIKTCLWCHQTVEVDDDVWGVVVEGSRSHYLTRPGPKKVDESDAEAEEASEVELAPVSDEPDENLPSVPPEPKKRKKQMTPTWSRDDAPKVDIVALVAKRKEKERQRAAKKAARLSVEQIQAMDLGV